MNHLRLRHFGSLATAAFIGLALAAAPQYAAAIDSMNPNPPRATSSGAASAGQPGAPVKKAKKHKKKKKHETQQQSSAEEFLAGYRVAYDLVYRQHDYVAGIAALRSLGHDNHTDVATMIGYASRKLGRYYDAKVWYDRAVAADPMNARVLSYYGMWHAEQGNRLKAEDYLARVQRICGNTSCREYAELKGVIDGTMTY